jgi:hypothetical protein
MKLITNKILPISIALLALVSCNETEDTISIPDDRSVITSSVSSMILEEGGAGQTVTLTVDKPSTRVLEYRVELINDTFTESGADLTLTDATGGAIEFVDHLYPPFDAFQIEIPAYATSYSFDVSALSDLDVEGTENKQIRIVPNKSQFGTTVNGASDGILIDVEITNYAQPNDDLIIQIAFEDSVYTDDDGDSAGGCDNDYDFELYNSAFALVGSSYYDCPEQIILSETAADGTYYLYVSLYALGGPLTTEAQDLPFNLVVAKQGIWYEEFAFSGLYDSAAGSGVEGNPNAGDLLAYTILKSGTTYSVVDSEGAVLASGRLANANFGRRK